MKIKLGFLGKRNLAEVEKYFNKSAKYRSRVESFDLDSFDIDVRLVDQLKLT
jgi:hypothetical protein